MTFNQGQELAIGLTEQEMAKMWDLVLETYRQANKTINDDLAKIYAKYLQGINPANGGFYNEMIKSDRLKKLQKQVFDEYRKASKKAEFYISKSSQIGFNNTFYREQYALEFFAPSEIGMTFSLLNPAITEASVFGTADLWKKIKDEAIEKVYGSASNYFRPLGSLTDLLLKNRAIELEQIQQLISSGLLRGDSYKLMSNNLSDIIGKVLAKDGKKMLSGAIARASLIIRTEGTRNYNAGFTASLHDAQAQGVGIEKEWLTAFINSRDTHKTANRQRVPLDGSFTVGSATGQYPGAMSLGVENYNCHCTHIAIVDGVDPALQRGRNPVTGKSEIFNYKDFDKWYAGHGMSKDKYGVILPKKG